MMSVQLWAEITNSNSSSNGKKQNVYAFSCKSGKTVSTVSVHGVNHRYRYDVSISMVSTYNSQSEVLARDQRWPSVTFFASIESFWVLRSPRRNCSSYKGYTTERLRRVSTALQFKWPGISLTLMHTGANEVRHRWRLSKWRNRRFHYLLLCSFVIQPSKV